MESQCNRRYGMLANDFYQRWRAIFSIQVKSDIASVAYSVPAFFSLPFFPSLYPLNLVPIDMKEIQARHHIGLVTSDFIGIQDDLTTLQDVDELSPANFYLIKSQATANCRGQCKM
ncbi:hypothetical protein DM01DRAFT_1105072 [Hesseltinella vesiculosa]|uniref:Uncharacterized protein n=1 Tax=Hesseltinella vesiculosa TaxID=101127 RepID=A0A1X2GAP6_9FUNG|nr:hypothetical protein DM01DRAFT_1105072 [Hesseltinella vesiculosa]